MKVIEQKFTGGGNFRPYIPPAVLVEHVTVESGFADSLAISAPDDDLPQIDNIDNWNEWD